MLIAGRTLKYRTAGKSIPIEIRIFMPQQLKTDYWECAYEVDWPDGKKRWPRQAWIRRRRYSMLSS